MTSFVILIDSDCFANPVLDDVLRFCKAALSRGDSIEQIFFYRAAVTAVLAAADLPADEPDLLAPLQQLCAQQQIPMYYCATAAEKRGVHHVRAGIELSGLAQFAMSLPQHKLVQF